MDEGSDVASESNSAEAINSDSDIQVKKILLFMTLLSQPDHFER